MTREIVHIAGDRQTGVTVSHNLSRMALGEVVMIYRGQYAVPHDELELICEVYEQDGVLGVHAICPKCHHAIWINGKNKSIEYDRSRGLFIEPFQCTWEMDDWRREFGASLCGMRMAFDGKLAKEA
jgi:hypothetical protein